MRVTCLKNLGTDLPRYYYDLGFNPQTEFGLEVGGIYVVYAICLWKEGIIHYLVVDDKSQKPAWYPAVLFSVASSAIPRAWKYAFWGGDENCPISAVWGYDELVDRVDYFDQLAEMHPSALNVFFARKEEIELDA